MFSPDALALEFARNYSDQFKDGVDPSLRKQQAVSIGIRKSHSGRDVSGGDCYQRGLELEHHQCLTRAERRWAAVFLRPLLTLTNNLVPSRSPRGAQVPPREREAAFMRLPDREESLDLVDIGKRPHHSPSGSEVALRAVTGIGAP